MAHPNHSYLFLQRLSTQALEELIQSDFNGSGLNDDALVLAALEELKTRTDHQSPLPDLDSAWSAFHAHYNTPELADVSLYETDPRPDAPVPAQVSPSRRGKRVLRTVITLAAALALLICSAIAVQASGIDLFGRLATWTEETFSFVADQLPEHQEDDDRSGEGIFTDALTKVNMPYALVPTWFPKGFVPDDINTFQDDMLTTVSTTFWNESKLIQCALDWYPDESMIGAFTVLKDDTPPEVIDMHGIPCFIISNGKAWVATWRWGNHVGLVGGDVSHRDIVKIVKSLEVFKGTAS